MLGGAGACSPCAVAGRRTGGRPQARARRLRTLFADAAASGCRRARVVQDSAACAFVAAPHSSGLRRARAGRPPTRWPPRCRPWRSWVARAASRRRRAAICLPARRPSTRRPHTSSGGRGRRRAPGSRGCWTRCAGTSSPARRSPWTGRPTTRSGSRGATASRSPSRTWPTAPSSGTRCCTPCSPAATTRPSSSSAAASGSSNAPGRAAP